MSLFCSSGNEFLTYFQVLVLLLVFICSSSSDSYSGWHWYHVISFVQIHLAMLVEYVSFMQFVL